MEHWSPDSASRGMRARHRCRRERRKRHVTVFASCATAGPASWYVYAMSHSVGEAESPCDLAGAVFAALAAEFFTADGQPTVFKLRFKRQTQDDPFDEYAGEILRRRLPDGIRVLLSGKPLVSPDLVVARPEEAQVLMQGGGDLDSRYIIAIEVKKLNWDAPGVGRGTGMDYNSTPPCSTVKVETNNGQLLRIVAFYLYVVLQLRDDDQVVANSMALVSGAALNEDIDLYDAITGIRQKRIGIGSYGDGIDRQRPMLVFANPLGWPWLIGHVTLVHPSHNLEAEQNIEMRRRMYRRTREGETREFFCYRIAREEVGEPEPDVTEPFPTPANRKTDTTPRGRFKIALAVEPE